MLQPGCEFGVLSQKFLCGHDCVMWMRNDRMSESRPGSWMRAEEGKRGRPKRQKETRKKRSNACNKPQRARMIAILSLHHLCSSHLIPSHSSLSSHLITLTRHADIAARHQHRTQGAAVPHLVSCFLAFVLPGCSTVEPFPFFLPSFLRYLFPRVFRALVLTCLPFPL